MANQQSQRFGVLQREGGSYTMGAARFLPLRAVAASAEVAEKADKNGQVKFFGSRDAAEKEVARLKEEFGKKQAR